MTDGLIGTMLAEARKQTRDDRTHSYSVARLADLFHAQGCAALNAGCFCAGTLVWTAEGYRPVEELAEGDLVLSRDECDPDGPILARPVEAVFRRLGSVLGLRLEGGLTIRTTPEHHFFADGHALAHFWISGRNTLGPSSSESDPG